MKIRRDWWLLNKYTLKYGDFPPPPTLNLRKEGGGGWWVLPTTNSAITKTFTLIQFARVFYGFGPAVLSKFLIFYQSSKWRVPARGFVIKRKLSDIEIIWFVRD